MSASLAEVLNGLPNLTAPAACASQGATEFLGAQSNPRQVMSQTRVQTFLRTRFACRRQNQILTLMSGQRHVIRSAKKTMHRMSLRQSRCIKKSKKNLSQSQEALEHHCKRNQVKHLFVMVGGPMSLRDTTQDRLIKRQLTLRFHGLMSSTN